MNFKGTSHGHSRMAHTALGILFAINLLNYIDRSVLNGMLPLIKEEWNVSDARLGLLVSAFLFSYMIISPVFGWLGDRYTRKWICGAGVAAWSLFTAASALARSFGHLFGLRMILGIGESSYSTVAPTMITDLYPRQNRSKMLAFYYVAGPVGTALGFILGGALGVRFGWRSAFLMVGLPGLLMALSMLFIEEPVRGQSEDVDEEDLSKYLETSVPFKSYLELIRNKSYVIDTIGMTLTQFVMGALAAWLPTFFYRVRKLDLDEATLYIGIITCVAGIVGTFCGGVLSDRLLRRWESAHFLVSGIGMLLCLPFLFLTLFSDNPMVYWPALFLTEIFLFLNLGPTNAILIGVVMPKMRATAFAINLFISHALGDVLSPIFLGVLSDKTNLRFSMLSTLPVLVVMSAAVYLIGVRYIGRDSQNVIEKIKAA